MPSAKTTAVIDEDLLKRFIKLVGSKVASTQGLSADPKEPTGAFSPAEIIRSVATKVGADMSLPSSLEQMSQTRPRVRVSAGKTVRKLRDKRELSLC